ncbi:MAG: hypothetical protein AUJ49_01170 [Desulfovibrionaceae bacterium CG1_02_65_16]|nr:MAG: hypothetical protein AUJ49_01170 [Desulfovibrionaceae bacterium CG1_02_65_16]
MNLAPIVLFVYNRPEHTRRTLQSLRRNALARHSRLFVFADGPKNEADAVRVGQVRAQFKDFSGFADVRMTFRNENRGLARSVIAGVSEVVAEHGRVIVMEDDLVSGHYFLTFMNQVLDRYADRPDIFSASGYVYPYTPRPDYPHDVLLLSRSSTWGWGTWRDRWEQADWKMTGARQRLNDPAYREALRVGGNDVPAMLEQWLDGRIDSWGLPWFCTHVAHQAGALFPVRNQIINIGLDGSGVHCSAGCRGNGGLCAQARFDMPATLLPDADMTRRVLSFFD